MGGEPILVARVDREDDGRLKVLSPDVGWWSDHPDAGALVGPGSRVGSLDHLNRRCDLRLPEGVAGYVTGSLPRDRRVPVEYDQLLFLLAPVGTAEKERLEAHAGRGSHPAPTGLAPGTWAIHSPTDGVFYRRPSAGARPFVEIGTRVRAGQPLGLVEVMKTFNQVLYGGPGLPEEAEVAEIRCGDAEEVRAGQVLIVFR